MTRSPKLELTRILVISWVVTGLAVCQQATGEFSTKKSLPEIITPMQVNGSETEYPSVATKQSPLAKGIRPARRHRTGGGSEHGASIKCHTHWTPWKERCERWIPFKGGFSIPPDDSKFPATFYCGNTDDKRSSEVREKHPGDSGQYCYYIPEHE